MPSKRPTELIEFHTLLVRMDAFDRIGLLDEKLLCHAEHGDLSMTLREAGYSIWLEPQARVTYAPPFRPLWNRLQYPPKRYGRPFEPKIRVFDFSRPSGLD